MTYCQHNHPVRSQIRQCLKHPPDHPHKVVPFLFFWVLIRKATVDTGDKLVIVHRLPSPS